MLMMQKKRFENIMKDPLKRWKNDSRRFKFTRTLG